MKPIFPRAKVFRPICVFVLVACLAQFGPSFLANAADVCELALLDSGESLSVATPQAKPVNSTFESAENPYIVDPDNISLLQFLKQVGVQIDDLEVQSVNPVQVAQAFNTLVDEKVKTGFISPQDTLYWADIYVGRDGKLIFVRLGAPAPEQARKFVYRDFKILGQDQVGRSVYVPVNKNRNSPRPSGFLADADYLFAISQGYFPGSFESRQVRLGSFSTWEPLFHHELGHVGGLVDHPKGMAAFRRALTQAWRMTEGKLSQNVQKRLFYVNELLPGLRPGTAGQLADLLAPYGLTLNSLLKLEDARAATNALSKAQVLNLAKQLLEFHRESRLPFGGALRTGGTTPLRRSKLDRTAYRLENFPELNSGYVHDVPGIGALRSLINAFHKPKYLSSSHERTVKELLADYLFTMQALNDTQFDGWFELAITSGAPAEGAYARYLCGKTIEQEYSRRYFLCP